MDTILVQDFIGQEIASQILKDRVQTREKAIRECIETLSDNFPELYM